MMSQRLLYVRLEQKIIFFDFFMHFTRDDLLVDSLQFLIPETA